MSLLRRAIRSIENPTVPLSGFTLSQFVDGAGTGKVTVTESNAMAMPAVWRAVNLLAGTGASLPLKAYDDDQNVVTSKLLTSPHPDLTPFEVAELRWAHLLLWGNSYAQKMYDGFGVREIHPLLPGKVKVGIRSDLRTAENPTGKVFKLGEDDRAYTPADVFHVPGLGYDGVTGVSPIRMAKAAIGLGLSAERYAGQLYESGSLLSGILQTEQRLKQGDADALKANWKSKVTGLDKAHEIAVLDAGAKFQPVSMPATDAQMIESRRFQIQEVARWYGIPPHMLGDVSGSTSWGSGIEQQSIGFVVYTLRPWLSRIEQRITKELLPREQYAKHKVEGLLRGDSAARAAFYNVMRQVGAYSPNDIRALEDMPPVEGGDTRLQPLNMEPLGGRDSSDRDEARALVEMVQKVYLGVGTVLTADEARRLLNAAGADLTIPGPDFGPIPGEPDAAAE